MERKTITKRSFEKAMSPLGSGVWIDKRYVLETCPFCSEAYSFQFQGATGQWRCVSCNEFGMSFKELEHRLSIRFVMLDKSIQEPEVPDGLIVLSEWIKPTSFLTIDSGWLEIDKITGGLTEGSLTVLSGKQSEGKSTFAGQLALNAVNQGIPVCFYSGELSVMAFHRWIYSQAAGPDFCSPVVDRYGQTRYEASPEVVPLIDKWLGKNLLLYDNSIAGASEAQSIIQKFSEASRYFGASLFIADNLMTVAQNTAGKDNFALAQSRFVGQLIDLAQQHRAHVILVAHPKKGDEDADFNDRISGIGDITRRSSNVMFLERLKQDQYEKMKRNGELDSDRTTNILHVSKNREYGGSGSVELTYDKRSRRLIQSIDAMESRYGWENYL